MKRLILSLILAISLPVRGQVSEDIDIAALAWVSATQAQVDFSVATDVDRSRLTVEMNPGLDPDEWRLFGDATLEDLGGGNWRVALPVAESAGRVFYRILKDGVPVETNGRAVEGDSSGVVVTFSKPFHGTLEYVVEFSNGTAAQTGSVAFDGLTGLIPVVVPEDEVSTVLHHVTVTLSSTDGKIAAQTVAVGEPLTLVIEDNDAVWLGLLEPAGEDKTIPISLEFLEGSSGSKRCLKAETTSFIPLNPDQADGCWPLTSLVASESVFNGEVTFTVPAGDTIYEANTLMTLTWLASGDAVTDRRVDGTFSITTSVPALPHLTFPQRAGTFTFFKQPRVSPLIEAPENF